MPTQEGSQPDTLKTGTRNSPLLKETWEEKKNVQLVPLLNLRPDSGKIEAGYVQHVKQAQGMINIVVDKLFVLCSCQ